MKRKVIAVGFAICLLGAMIAGSSMAKASAPDEENPQETVDAIGEEEDLSEEETELEEITGDETLDGEISEEQAEDDLQNDSQDNQEDEMMGMDENNGQPSVEIVGMKVTLLNQLSCDIVSIQASPALAEKYSDNLIPEQTLKAGEQIDFGIPEAYQNREGTLYDLLMTDANGNTIQIPMVPLLEDTTGELYEQYGLAMIRVVDKRLEAAEELPSNSELLKEQEKIKKALADSLTSDVEF